MHTEFAAQAHSIPDQSMPAATAVPAAAQSATGALASLSLCMLLPSLGTSIANIALPTLVRELHATFQQAQWVVLMFLLVTTTLVVSAGRLGDVVGRRRLLLSSVVLFTAASAGAAAAPALWVLIGARALQGIGAAAMLALTMTFVRQTVPRERTGSAMGMLGTMSAVGTALGPSLGGLLIAAFGWQSIFVINIPLGILALFLARRFLPEDAAEPRSPQTFDHLGTVMLAMALAFYALSMTFGKGGFGVLNAVLLAGAALGLVAFLRVQMHAVAPLVPLSMFRDRRMNAGLVVSALVSTVLMATLVVGPFYLSQGLRLDTGMVGLVMSVGPVVAAFTGAPAGRLVDRFGAQMVRMAGLAGMTFGCGSLALAPAALGVVGYLVPIAITTGSYAVFQTANNTGVMAGAAQGCSGVVSGLLTLARNLGLITGASALGAVFAAAAGIAHGVATSPADTAVGMRVTFAIATALILASLALAAWGDARGPKAAR